MKKRITALALLLALLSAVPAFAAAGGADDPLISRSYIADVYLDEVAEALSAAVRRALSDETPAARPDGLRALTLGAGDSVTLSDGQQLVLLSGGVRLTVERGRLINATLGRGSTGGDGRAGCRYVAWDGASVTALAGDEGAAVAVSPGVKTAVSDRPAPAPTPLPLPTPAPDDGGENPFYDVSPDAWYCADVLSAYRRGLVNGMTATTYAPEGELTLAQAVKLAACMHQLDRDGAVTLTNAEGGLPWFYTYAGYALEFGILDEMPMEGWDAPVTRAAYVRLFYRALPEERYARINEIMDGAIPDVPTDHPAAKEVYTFYAAGILTGYTGDGVHLAGAFDPTGRISRAEVATIMNRMFDAAARKRFDLN